MAGAYHIGLEPKHLEGNVGLGRYVFLPGDRSRAERIAARFEDVETVDNPRGHASHFGVLPSESGPVDVLAISTGMGPASVEIVAHELLELGARRLVRVGSSGGLAPEVPKGSVVVATGAVRDESTSDRWTPREYPALCRPEAVAAMCAGARAAGLAEHTFAGLVHSKDSYFGREYGVGPRGEENVRYMRMLTETGVLATEMEASLLFVLAACRSAGAAVPLSVGSAGVPVQAAAVLAVYGGVGAELTATADARAITVAVEGVRAWAAQDRGRPPLPGAGRW